MKKITSLLALSLLLVLSCEKEGPKTVNHITDLYSAPADATVMTYSNGTSTWSTDRRYFDLVFNCLSTTLVGYDALLAPGQYVIGGDQIGSAINTKVNGQAAGNGFITVNSKDGQYQITATINDQVYYWTGTLPFQADPAPTVLTQVLSAQSNVSNGTNSVTMNLATPGIAQEFDMTTYQTVWVGEGGYLALDLYSDDGYLHDGSFTACAVGGVIEPGQFGIGWDPGDLYGIGWILENWGTCWWDVANGAATATKITNGLVNVSSREEKVDDKDVTIWTITWGAEYPVEVLFEGAIPALTKPKKPDGPAKIDYLYTEAVTPGDGLDLHAVTITDKDGNELAYLELQTEPGATELTGSYPSTSYASAPGQMRDGYFIDLSAFGMEGTMEGGSYYIKDGVKNFIGAGTATVDVTKIATGAYRFTCEFFDYAAAGPDYVPGGEGGEEGDYVLLTKFANITDYTGWGMSMIALEFCTDGLTPTAGFFGATYEGDGNYLKLEIYSTSTDLAPGTYVPNEIGTDNVGEGQFKGGYDPAGASDYGTNWFTVTGGAGKSDHITDGTVTVSKDGDNYTIIVESSVVKCKYVGPLHN